MVRKQIAVCLSMLIVLYATSNAWGWASFKWGGIDYNDHGKLAVNSEKCVPLPKPPQKKCEKPVDDSVLYKALKLGSKEPDDKDGDTSPKHSYNPAYDPDKWPPAIRATLKLPNAKISAGTARETIGSEKEEAKKQVQSLTCDSGQGQYEKLWKQFGRLSHYSSDMASPLHAYSASVNGVYHEGDYVNAEWLKGLYDIGGKTWHWRSEIAMGEAIDGISCSQASNINPENAAGNARSVLNNYTSVKGNGSGFPAMIKDYETYPNGIRVSFFKEIGPQQVKDGIGVIKNVWQEALAGFTPPSGCDKPPTGGCGDCGDESCPPPGNDHPDDNFSVATASTPSLTSEEILEQVWDRMAVKKDKKSLPWFWMQSYLNGEYRLGNMDEATYKSRAQSYGLTSEVAWELFYNDYITTPDVAILGRGFAISMSDLMQSRFNEPVRRFTVEDFAPDAIKDYPVFVIPSGGLMGLENSEVFKVKLDEYVKQGGTLVVFAQQHGYEFSALPVPQETDGSYRNIAGYGWTEDQSCYANAAYIDTQHPMLSSINKSTPTLSIDGYFTNYPSITTVLLRRTANGQPAMITYDHGLGKVVVTSMFSDFALKSNQASSEEVTLVRDMISWAKKPAQLPEVKPGETAAVLLEAMNNTTLDAASVKITVYSPDRKTLLSEQTIAMAVPAELSVVVPVSYASTLTPSLGIYHIDYELYDANGLTSQPQAETDSGRFVVSNPPANQYKSPDFNFAINSDGEKYVYGSAATFTVTAWNNSNADTSVTFKYVLPHLGPAGAYDFSVSAKSSASFNIVVPKVTSQGWLYGTFYNAAGKYLGSAQKGIWMEPNPSIHIAGQTDKPAYAKGETVTLNTSLQNGMTGSYSITEKIIVTDPSGVAVFEDIKPVSLSSKGTLNISSSFALPQTAATGTYTIRTEVWYGAGRVSTGSTTFELPESQVSVMPNLPVLATGPNTIPFTLNNIGKIPVSSGVLKVSLKDPDGTEIYTNSQAFIIQPGESKTIQVPISIPFLKFGSYTLTYAQSDETRTGKPTSITVVNNASIAFSFDKLSYRVRETANLTLDLANTGKFALENTSVRVVAPGVNYADAKTINIGQGSNEQLPFSISIPETAEEGQHDVTVTVTLPSGNSLTQITSFTIPGSALRAGYSGQTNILAGDIVNLTIENTGGVDTTYTAEELTITDDKGVAIYQGNVAGTILAEEKKFLTDIQIPAQALNGSVALYAVIKDIKTSKQSYFYKNLEITGLTAELQTRTDKAAYLKTESITAVASLTNGQLGIENGTLKLTVNKMQVSGAGQFNRYLPKEGSGVILTGPSSVAIGPDGSLYVNDSGVQMIKKFDRNGNFVTQWGSYGTGSGQFMSANAIAVAADGSVYVTDSRNYRVQKFDSNGTYITEWGARNWQRWVQPADVAVGQDGYVYISTANAGYIFKMDSSGNLITSWGGYGIGNGLFRWAADIDISSDGAVNILDGWAGTVQKFDSNGNFIAKMYLPDNDIGGITTDFDNSLYATNYSSNKIQKIDNNGNVLREWGGYCRSDTNRDGIPDQPCDGQFYYPLGIAVGPDNSLYVAEYSNNRIQRMAPADSGAEVLFETTIPLNQSAHTTQDYSASIGILDTTGKLYLRATLTNSIGQTIAKSEYPFYVIEGNTLLLFSADKKVYRPGEPVTITGEVTNLASIAASGLTLSLSSQFGTQSSPLYTATFDVPANGRYPFTIATTASAEGVYTLYGKVIQNGTSLTEITDQYEMASPKITAAVALPDLAGNDPFDINVEIKNDGKTVASVQLTAFSDQGDIIDDRPVILSAGETKLLQYSRQIICDTTYTFIITGDLNQSITKTVSYGLAASIAVNPQAVYPEGKVAIPVTITNTGQLDETLNIDFSLQPVALSRAKAYSIPKGGSITDTLYYDLAEGDYQFSTVSNLPEATADAAFTVRKEKKVNMSVTVGAQTIALIPVTVNLTNLGYSEISGSAQISVISSQGKVSWNHSQNVFLPSNSQFQTPYLYVFNIDPSALAQGDYTLRAELLNNSNQQLVVSSQPLIVKGPIFQITQLPSYQTFTTGQEASFTFKLKNVGNQEGSANLGFKAYDLINSTRTEWLKPGEEKEISFAFMQPEDIETKDYFADYTLTPTFSPSGEGVIKGQVKYHLAGINLGVNASLDKQTYAVGDTAHLTLTVSDQQSAVGRNLFARLNYADFEAQQQFTLNGSTTLTFDIPLPQITGEKLFYGIYHELGRSIHLNSLYIHKAGDVITITTNKQVYSPGETVSAAISSQQSAVSGTMTLTAPGYSETFAFSGTASKSFTLPLTMTAGTYSISAQLSAVSGEAFSESHSFDVAGIQVKVLECKNDKGKYASSDTITTELTVSSNTTMPAVLKTWIVDPEGKYTAAGETTINLNATDNALVSRNSALLTAVSGIHKLVYGIYSGDLLLVSGSEVFDVGDAVLLGLKTDKADYPTNAEAVKATASIYGSVPANMEFQLNGTTVKNESVVLDGFSTLELELGSVTPGSHVLKGILTAGGLKSTKETSFVYGSNLPDLVAAIGYQQSAISNDNTVQIMATAANQGRMAAAATTIALYDGDTLIEAKQVNALNSGEFQEIAFVWNVLGKTGARILRAVIDPDNTVIEFNEANNISTLNIVIPDITFVTGTDKDVYKIRQDVNILSFIKNLSSEKTFSSLTLITTAKDPLGNEVFTNTVVLTEIQPLGTKTDTAFWNTTGLNAEGIYTINQKLLADSQVLAQSTKTVTLRKIADFAMITDSDYKSIKQGEKATYTAYLEPLDGWSSGITLNLQGLPAGTSVSFTPDNLTPPGEALTVIITTDVTAAGKYVLNLVAEGLDEGQLVTHALPLTLDVLGFGLETMPAAITLKQLETAIVDLNLTALNGYTGEVTLTISGAPHGVRASVSSMSVQTPGNAQLTILTSKYVKPAIYTLTVTGDDGIVKHRQNITLNLLANPDIAAGIITAQGPGPQNQALVRVFSADIQPVLDLTAFSSKYGTNVASADIDGDGYDEIIVAEGPDPKNPATLRAFRRNGALIAEYTAFDTKYGLALASGDIDGDWKDELIVGMGPDPKNPATLKVLKYQGTGFIELMSYTAYPGLKYGINATVGDVDGDGLPEIITAPGPGPNNQAVISIWKQDGQRLVEVSTLTAFVGGYGVNITTGDIDGDGQAEIIAGTGPDPKNPAVVRAFRSDGTAVLEFAPYSSSFGYGVSVAAADIDSDGMDEIITGLGYGPQNPSWVKVFKADGSELTSFISYPENVKYGVKVYNGRTGK